MKVKQIKRNNMLRIPQFVKDNVRNIQGPGKIIAVDQASLPRPLFCAQGGLEAAYGMAKNGAQTFGAFWRTGGRTEIAGCPVLPCDGNRKAGPKRPRFSCFRNSRQLSGSSESFVQ
jgi:hypothetical protein